MSKINISFNDTEFQIDESALSTATSALQQHLSTVMNGTGATITLGGIVYSIDATKLSAAEDEFESYLSLIGADTPSEERLEGDGAEYYTLAPTALSFRSTAPLNELQEIQINGVTVDPSNYTLEEGSTIVTFPIDYLKTLNVGSYEVTVASDSKSVKGDFTVKAPELNEHGFYYNQPYTAYIEYFGANTTLFIREDGVLDAFTGGATEVCSYVVDENNMTVMSASVGELHCVISTDGIYCTELGATFTLGDASIVADEEYIYVYREDLGGYEITVIDRTKTHYAPIRTGINGYDTLGLSGNAFGKCKNMESITILDNIISIEHGAFNQCTSLTSIFVDENNANYKSVNGDLYTKDGKTLIAYAIGKNDASFVIPNDVTTIAWAAFDRCLNLTNVTIPSGVQVIDACAFRRCQNLQNVNFMENSQLTSIAPWCFEECSNLRSIVIPDRVTSINTEAFYSCSQLTSVIIPDGVTYIADKAFSGCIRLTSVTIPDGVTYINDRAFFSCSRLASVTIPDSVTTIGDSAFSNCPQLIIYCEANTQPSGWNLGWNSSDLPVVWNCNNNDIATDGCIYIVMDSVRYVLKDNKITVEKRLDINILEVNIPASIVYKENSYAVTTIGDGAFQNSTELTSVIIPDSVTYIADKAFSGCRQLTSVTIPDGVTTIAWEAFQSCTSLESIIYSGTIAQWGKMERGLHWNKGVPATYVQCSDGQVAL